MKTSLIYPCRKLVQKITEISPPQKLRQTATLIYKGQVPNIALLLIQGVVELVSNIASDQIEVHEPCVICLKQLLDGSQSKADVVLCAGSEFSFLDSRGLEELLKFVCIDVDGVKA